MGKEATYDDPATQVAIRTTAAASLKEAQQRVAAAPQVNVCAVCQGDFVRIGGKLYCGFCGCPQERGKAVLAKPSETKDQTTVLQERIRDLETQLAAEKAKKDQGLPAAGGASAAAKRK